LEKKRKNSEGKIIKSYRGVIGNILWFYFWAKIFGLKIKFFSFSFTKTKYFTLLKDV